MKVLGICGSPHSKGNTAYALDHALAFIRSQGIETIYVSLADKRITPCDGCFTCRGTGECVHHDDMTIIYDSLRHCDGLILASPVYMGLVSGQVKVMMCTLSPIALHSAIRELWLWDRLITMNWG